jgi:hypothetical protein
MPYLQQQLLHRVRTPSHSSCPGVRAQIRPAGAKQARAAPSPAEIGQASRIVEIAAVLNWGARDAICLDPGAAKRIARAVMRSALDNR